MSGIDKYKTELQYYFGTINQVIKHTMKEDVEYKLMVKNTETDDVTSTLSDTIKYKLIKTFKYNGGTYVFEILGIKEKVIVIGFVTGIYRVVTCKAGPISSYIFGDIKLIIEIFDFIYDNICKYKKIILCGHSYGFVCATIISYCLLCLSSNDDILQKLPDYHNVKGFIASVNNTDKYKDIFYNLQLKIFICGTGGYPILWQSQNDFKIYFDFYKEKYIHLNYGITFSYKINEEELNRTLIDPYTLTNSEQSCTNYNMYTMLNSSAPHQSYLPTEYESTEKKMMSKLKSIKDYTISILLTEKLSYTVFSIEDADKMKQYIGNALHNFTIYREAFFNFINSSIICLNYSNIIKLYYTPNRIIILNDLLNNIEIENKNKYIKYKNKYIKLKSFLSHIKLPFYV